MDNDDFVDEDDSESYGSSVDETVSDVEEVIFVNAMIH